MLFSDINELTLQQQRSLGQAGNSDTSANLRVYIDDTSALSTSDYEVTFTSATGYSVRRLSDGKDMGSYDLTDLPPPVIDGFTLALDSGSVAAGDRFTILPTRHAAGDIKVSMTDSNQLAFAAPWRRP